jgi:hypothetical protein
MFINLLTTEKIYGIIYLKPFKEVLSCLNLLLF